MRNIYIWKSGWRTDYSDGILVVIAKTVDEARTLATATLSPLKENPEEWAYDSDAACRQALLGEPEIYPVNKSAVVADEYGGG